MINQVHCLCLDKRQNLWPKIEEDCERLTGLKVNKFIVGDGKNKNLKYDYVDSKDKSLWNLLKSPAQHSYLGHANAFLAHKQLFSKIYEKYRPKNAWNVPNKGNILFLEDDCLFLNRFEEIYNNEDIQDFLSQKDFDILFLGWWKKFYKVDSVDGNLIEQAWCDDKKFGITRELSTTHNKISGLHGAVINSSFLKVLANVERGPIDSFINENLDKYRVFYIYPKIIHTISTWSYCENHDEPRSELE